MNRDLEGTAVIQESERGSAYDPGGFMPWDWGLNVVGKRTYRFRLEVRVPGHQPYEVQGKFKVPRKAENTSVLSRANKLQPGLELPVRVASGALQDVEVDWERFLASANRKQAIGAATHSTQKAQLRNEYDRNPKLLAQLRAGNRAAVHAWAEAVRAGSMSRDEFEQTVALEVETGRMDPADAETARRTLE